ncbi:MAG: pantoate--beta-alanine ligase [Verrucomicrobiota bacterium]|nr:pantoate--beta-alanine ligase [Verrucomicrobiota bacterium]
MKNISSISEMRQTSLAWKREGKRIGFVPTMGFLHGGHLALIRKAREIADVVAVSIFVNPTQFGPGEDYERYPRDLERDTRLCEEAGVDAIFCPRVEDMYPEGWSVHVDEARLSAGLCGRSRPGHFSGVLTVVAKLFNIVLPDTAVFGEKDAQQARLVRQLVVDLNLPVRIRVLATVREPDGLAMSSRNARLSPGDRKRAAVLYGALCRAQAAVRGGERRSSAIRENMRTFILSAMAPVDIEYIEIVDAETLVPVDVIENATLIAMAAMIGGARLIDNVTVAPGGAR